MKEITIRNPWDTQAKETNEDTPSFDEIKDGDTVRFTCRSGNKEIGAISATLMDKNIYNIGGLFVDSSKRGQGIGSSLVKLVNAFLERNNSLGKLANTIQGDAAQVYENNNWVKGNFKSQGAYGAYEYIYDCRKNLN